MNTTTTTPAADPIGIIVGLNAPDSPDALDERGEEKVIMLLARAHETADVAYGLIRMTSGGIRELNYLAQLVKGVIAATDRFDKMSFYLPAGADVYLMTDDDEQNLDHLIDEDILQKNIARTRRRRGNCFDRHRRRAGTRRLQRSDQGRARQ